MSKTPILTDQEVENGSKGGRELDIPEQCRRSQRRAYSAVQSIAPCDGYTLPTKGELRPVRCHDLSTTGIGLRLPEKPDFEYVVVALGESANQVHVLARVVHSRPVARGYVVGCRFLRKVELDA